MAIGSKSDFIIYSAQFWGGAIETLQQNADAFNGASLNVLRLVTRSILGDFERESFLKSTSGLVSRRDVTVNTAVTSGKLAAGELAGVKVNRRIGPVDQNRDSFKKIGVDPKEFSTMLGEQAGVAIAIDYINVALEAVNAAIKNQAALLQYDATGDTIPTMNHNALVSSMAKFGDKASRLLAFVMHSSPYYTLVKQSISDKIVNVADISVKGGTAETLGKPTIVIDSPVLVTLTAGSPLLTTYSTLCLTENAVEVAESEERDILSQPQTGLENLVDRIQGEYAFNVRVKGCAYDTTQGVNPTDTTLATAATWLMQVADVKEMPGTLLKTK